MSAFNDLSFHMYAVILLGTKILDYFLSLNPSRQHSVVKKQNKTVLNLQRLRAIAEARIWSEFSVAFLKISRIKTWS